MLCFGAMLAVSCGSDDNDNPGGNGNGTGGGDDGGGDEPETEVYAAYAESDFRGNGKYILILSTAATADCETFTSEGICYEIELFAEPAPDGRQTGPADGTYTFDPASSKDAGTFGASYSGGYHVRKRATFFEKDGVMTKFTSGTIEVSHAEGKLRVKADLKLKDDTHDAFAAKDFIMLGNADRSTTLTADRKLDLSQVSAAEMMWMDLDNGNGTWWIFLESKLPDTDAMQLLLYTASTVKTEIPAGTFTAGVDGVNVPGVAGTFRPGSYWPDLHQFYTSYYYKKDARGKFYADQAMLKTGTVTITDAGNETWTYTFDVQDELGHRVTGSWTGPVSLM